MRKRNAVRLAVLAAFGAAAGGAQAISFTANNWTLDINGTVNAFYVQGEQKDTPAGGPTTTTDRANVQNGLLPGWINFVATTKQKQTNSDTEWDIKAHFGFAPGIQNNGQIVGLPSGTDGSISDAYAKVDSRNVYFQFGRADIGTFKFGRDIGLFMKNPILADMTLLGVGGTVRAAEPFNTSFGMIGHGYMYVGFEPQITYSRNVKLAAASLDFAVGVFNPSQFEVLGGGPAGTEKKTPQFQGLVEVGFGGGSKAWVAGMINESNGTPANPGSKAEGLEGGVKLCVGVGCPLEGVLSAFTGKGMGISTIGAQFLIPQAQPRLKSDGYFAQLTFKPVPPLKLGLSYGQNTDKELTAPGVDTKRKAYAAGLYYTFTPAITLVGEYINEKGTNFLATGATQKANSISLGAILFF